MSNKILTQNQTDDIRLRLGFKDQVELTRDEVLALINGNEECHGVMEIECNYCGTTHFVNLEKK